MDLNRYKYILNLISSTSYSRYNKHLKDIMSMTVDKGFMRDPTTHFECQKAILTILEEVEPLVTKGRKLAEQENNTSYEEQADRNKLIAGAYREIANRFAYRTLGFDRIRLRILAQSDTPGFVSTPHESSKAGRKAELQLAETFVKNGGFASIEEHRKLVVADKLSANEYIYVMNTHENTIWK